jgi:competence protein ComEA
MANQPVKRRAIWNRVIGRSDLSPHTSDKQLPLLTRSDQRAVAILVAIALVFITTSWLVSRWDRGGLVDIDNAEPLESKFATDINSADWTELAQLPEIGEALAKRIVEWREREGPFASHDDLDRVPGIGSKTLDRIRPYLQPID